MKFWFVIPVLLFAINVHSQITWKDYSDQSCSFQYPDSWRLIKEDSTGAHLFLFMPKDGPDDNFRENVNLLIQDLTQFPMTLKEFVKLSEEQVQKLVKQSEIHFSKTIKKKGKSHHEIEYTGEQNGRLLKFLQHYWVIENQAYILTYTAAPDKYEEYLKHIDMMFSSFTIIDTE